MLLPLPESIGTWEQRGRGPRGRAQGRPRGAAGRRPASGRRAAEGRVREWAAGGGATRALGERTSGGATALLGRAGRVDDGRATARASGIGVERSCGGSAGSAGWSAGGAKEADALQFPCSLLVGLG